LIEKNLHPTPDDPRPTHVSDLEGYYDLVKMEIEDIDACFDVVRRLRDNDWKPITTNEEENRSKSNQHAPPPPPTNKPRQPQQQRRANKESTNARAEAAKQRLKEAKEAAMQKKKQVEAESGFTPDEAEFPS